MNDLHELEQDLRSTLHHYADTAPDGDGWRPIHDRIARRHRTRQVKRSVGAFALMAVTITGMVSLVDRGVDRRVEPGTVPAAVPSPPTTVPTDLPRLVPDVAGFEVAHADEFDPAETDSAPGRPPGIDLSPGDIRMTSLLEPAKGYEGRVLLVTVVGAQVAYGIGEDPSSTDVVDISGLTGYLIDYTSLPATSLGWRLPDGRAVHLIGLRLSHDDLVAAGRAIQVAADSTVTWPEGSMPADLAFSRSSVVPKEPARTSEVLLKGDRKSLDLRLRIGGEGAFYHLVRDRAASSAYISSVSVSGLPGVFSMYERYPSGPGGQDSRGVSATATLMWQVRPGVVAELVTDGVIGDKDAAQADLIGAAESLREISEAEWRALIDRGVMASTEVTAEVQVLIGEG
jgi:hypothetical protein